MSYSGDSDDLNIKRETGERSSDNEGQNEKKHHNNVKKKKVRYMTTQRSTFVIFINILR